MSFFTPEQIDHLSQSTVRCDFLVKFDFASETIRVWNGNTKLEAGGHLWQPMYGAGGIDGLSLTPGTVSETVTFQLGGLPDQAVDFLSHALEETPEVLQQLVTVFLQLFDEDWQPVGIPIGLWWGFMQPPRVSRTEMQGAEGAVQSIKLTAENAFFNRSRPPYGRYTDRDQQKRSPGDKFFTFIGSLIFKVFRYPDF